MSTLISSAVAGKKTAPKGAPRRRPAPPPGAAKQSTPISVSSTHTSVAPPSPPPTQLSQPAPVFPQGAATPPRPASPVQSRSQLTQPEASPRPTAIRTPTPITGPTASASQQTPAEDDELPPPALAQPPKKRKADQPLAKAATQPAKRVKRSSARSSAVVQAQVNEEETPLALDPVLGSAEPAVSASPAPPAPAAQQPKKPRKGGRKKKAPVTEGADDGSPQHDLDLLDRQLAQARGEPEPGRRKKRKQKAAGSAAESGAEADAQQGADGAQDQSESSDAESDPELHEIDPNTVTMFDVSYDKKHGKVSEREKRMAEIDWREVARKRREENDRAALAAQAPPASENIIETTEGATGQAEPPPPEQEGTAVVSGVPLRVVNGQIIIDDEGLTINRQEQAQAQAEDDEPVEEENDLTRRINNATHLHDRRRDIADRVPVWKRKSDPWTDEETDRFYEQLAIYGTDFYMISTLFAPKTRRQIKSKFTREEKLDPQRINDALLGRTRARPKLSLEHYARETGRSVSDFTRYENAEHAEEVIRESMREKEQEMRDAIREEELAEEAAREALVAREKGKKKAAERKAAGEGVAKRGGGKRGGRKKVNGGLGGGGPPEEGAAAAAAVEG